MFNAIGTVSLFVADQDRAKQFYTEMLGFELRGDEPLGPDTTTRWITVAPKGAHTELVLYLPDENWTHYTQVVGKSQALTITVTDLDKLYQDLTAKGVKFAMPPRMEFFGYHAFMIDSEGNSLMLYEAPKEGAPSAA
jgi:catechol 2,3-dioxygenase-like lactoylglutathione lyase family enzyme